LLKNLNERRQREKTIPCHGKLPRLKKEPSEEVLAGTTQLLAGGERTSIIHTIHYKFGSKMREQHNNGEGKRKYIISGKGELDAVSPYAQRKWRCSENKKVFFLIYGTHCVVLHGERRA